MVFSSLIFIFLFLPVMIGLPLIAPLKWKNPLLVLLSLFFYAWGEPYYVLIMIISILINFLSGIAIDRHEGRMRKAWLIFALVFNLSLLAVFKYTGFFVENINHIFGLSVFTPSISLPIGISFYTFQSLSYIIDVYRNRTRAQESLISVALYISLFPQLIAGPIVRYTTIEEQIRERHITLLSFGEGVRRFLLGLGKKVLIANTLGEFVDLAFAYSPVNLSTSTAWLAILAYALQIYFDFSGYSDMAIGLGKMLGFEFEENFNYPYISRSASEFWRRWHISLGTWFRDYLYIPLGGNRVGLARGARNLFIVWFLTGLWHGASWNFVLWGLWFGFFIFFERTAIGKSLIGTKYLSRVYLVLIVLIGWVMFRSDGLSYALTYFQVMFTEHGNAVANVNTIVYLRQYGISLLIGILAATPMWELISIKIRGLSVKWHEIGQAIFYTLVFLLVILSLVNSTYNPFIYFRF